MAELIEKLLSFIAAGGFGAAIVVWYQARSERSLKNWESRRELLLKLTRMIIEIEECFVGCWSQLLGAHDIAPEDSETNERAAGVFHDRCDAFKMSTRMIAEIRGMLLLLGEKDAEKQFDAFVRYLNTSFDMMGQKEHMSNKEWLKGLSAGTASLREPLFEKLNEAFLR